MQPNMPKQSVICCCAILLLLIGPLAKADIIFSASPRIEPAQAIEIYTPFIRYLETIVGEPVVFEPANSWREYSINMRNDHYDIVFDAPHFSSWRIANINHIPVVRLPGQIGYVVLANRTNDAVSSLRDLVKVETCSLSSPSLSTMTVYHLFKNPVQMPQIKEISGDFTDVYRALKNGECSAAVLRDIDYQYLVPQEKHSVKIIAKSDTMPERTITISQRLSDKKTILTKMLTSVEGSKAASNIFLQFGKERKIFIPVRKAEYKDLDDLLSHVVWGW